MKKPNDYQDFNGLVAEAQASQELYDSAFLLKAVRRRESSWASPCSTRSPCR